MHTPRIISRFYLIFHESFYIVPQQVKILLYIVLAASDDVETQRKGIISIIWPGTKLPNGDNLRNVKLNRILFLKRVYESLPVRTCSIHFGIPHSPFNQLMQTLTTLSMPQYMQRMKFHVGTFLLQCVSRS